METRANNIAIGAFVLTVVTIAFLFTFWLLNAGDRSTRRDIRIVFPGAVTGLPIGGQVLFNGIKIGDVTALKNDQNDPKLVIATVRVDANAPLRKDTIASLGFTGLTGVAYVDLSGGSRTAPPLLEGRQDNIPVLYARRSQFEDLIEGAKDILRSADSTLSNIDDLVNASRPDIEKTIKNIESFTNALADNSQGVDDFLAGITETSKALTGLSGKISNLVERGDALLANVPPDKLADIVQNVERMTQKLAASSDGVGEIIENGKKASVQLVAFTDELKQSLSQVEAVIAAISPEDVERTLQGAADLGGVLTERRGDINSMLASASAVATNAQQVIKQLADNKDAIDKIVQNAEIASAEIVKTTQNANNVIAAVEPRVVRKIVASVETVTTSLSAKTPELSQAIDEISKAANSVNQMADVLNKRVPDVDRIIGQAKTVASNLTAASVRVNTILDNVNGMVSADGQGFIKEATEAAASIRKVADAFEQKAEPISAALLKLSQQGGQDFTAAMQQLNQTLIEIRRAVTNFDRNPNRVIFGGSDTPVFNGAQRR